MKIEKIKPVPKYIVNIIKKVDKLNYPKQDGCTRYYSYLTKNDKELCKVTVAVRNQRKKWYYKQCAVHGVNSDFCFVKDMIYFIVSGYKVGWYDEGITRVKKYYEDGKWYYAENKYYDPFAPIVNKNYIGKIDKYKYSAYKEYPYTNLLKYLKTYEQYPEVEYLTKMGLAKLTDKKQILEKCHKDKTFRKWLFSHKDEIKNNDIYVSVILKAYRKNLPMDRLQRYLENKLTFSKSLSIGYKEIKQLFNDKLEPYFDYIAQQGTNNNSYLDYIKACKELEIDLSIEKNLMPHNFQKWHDIRIDEYRTLLAERDKKLRKELYDNFAKVAEKYSDLQRENKSTYVVLIAHSPDDLKKEGDALHHCVGRMNYDQKFAREESLIFFIRNKEEKDIPLVTVEYSISQKKVLQCYGDKDSIPSEEIKNFVYKSWLPYANKQLKKIAA